MRRRSNAVHAPSFEEFKTVSITKQNETVQSSSSPYVVSSLTRSLRDVRSEKSSAAKEKMRSDPDLWKDFNFTVKSEYEKDVETLEDASQASTAESSYCASPTLSPEFSPKAPVRTANVMMVGPEEAGLHGLVDKLFDDQSSELQAANKKFDLVIKEHASPEQRYKLKFWIHDPSSKKHETIISVYYKTIQFYVFVYRPNDRQSFDCLVETIQKIKAKAQKFAGVLIRDVTSLESSLTPEVSEEEVEGIRQRYGLMGEVQTSESAEEARQEVLKMVNRQSETKTAEFLLKACLVKQDII